MGTTAQAKLSRLILLLLHTKSLQSLGKLTLATTHATKVTAETQDKAVRVLLGVQGDSLTALQPQERMLAPEHGVVVHTCFSLWLLKEPEFVRWSLAPSADKPPLTCPSPASPSSAQGTRRRCRLEGPCPANVIHISFSR